MTQRIGQAFDSTALKNLQQSVKDLAAISGRLVKFANAQTDRMDRVARTSRTLRMRSPAWRGRLRAQWPGWTAQPMTTSSSDILENSRNSSADVRAAAADLRSVMAAARAERSQPGAGGPGS